MEVVMEIDHDPRCSYWVDEICVCQQIADAEEKAEWVGAQAPPSPLGGFGTTYPFMGTMTAAYPYVTSTYAMGTPYKSSVGGSSSATLYSETEKEAMAHIKAREDRRAEIYARADARRKAEGGF